MNEELKNDPKALFVTLTFNNESMQKLSKELFHVEQLNYEQENELCKTAIRRFLERNRKKNEKVEKTLVYYRKRRRLRQNTPTWHHLVRKGAYRPMGKRIYIHRRLCK